MNTNEVVIEQTCEQGAPVGLIELTLEQLADVAGGTTYVLY